jgi:hypothetical protein
LKWSLGTLAIEFSKWGLMAILVTSGMISKRTADGRRIPEHSRSSCRFNNAQHLKKSGL